MPLLNSDNLLPHGSANKRCDDSVKWDSNVWRKASSAYSAQVATSSNSVSINKLCVDTDIELEFRSSASGLREGQSSARPYEVTYVL